RALVAWFAFAGDTHCLAFLHPCGNLDRHLSLFVDSTRAVAVDAFVFHDRSTTPAMWTGRHHSEHSAQARLCDTTLSAAGAADRRRSPRLRARAFAGFTFIGSLEFDRLFGAGRYFVQRQFNLSFKIESSIRSN